MLGVLQKAIYTERPWAQLAQADSETIFNIWVQWLSVV